MTPIQKCLVDKNTKVNPVWLMRQAGRYLPEFREIRKSNPDFIKLCLNHNLSEEITLQPIRRYGVDAAILYSDIVVPVHAIGFGVDIKPGVGPVAIDPFRSSSDLNRLRSLNPQVDTPYVLETIQRLVDVLKIPLIGFAGAPFTVASYLIEGGPSRSYQKTKAMMFSDKSLWDSLMERLTDITIESLVSQIEAGASAVQLFDSWAGSLSPAQYEQFVLPHSQRIFEALSEHSVPRIHFGVGTGEILHLMSAAGADVVGVDWRVPIDEARKRIGVGKSVQGNLDPLSLLQAGPDMFNNIDHILDAFASRPHIFNLGHGITPSTPIENVQLMLNHVRQRHH